MQSEFWFICLVNNVNFQGHFCYEHFHLLICSIITRTYKISSPLAEEISLLE